MARIPADIQLEGFRRYCLFVYEDERKLLNKDPQQAMQDSRARVLKSCSPKMRQHITTTLGWAKGQFGD